MIFWYLWGIQIADINSHRGKVGVILIGVYAIYTYNSILHTLGC